MDMADEDQKMKRLRVDLHVHTRYSFDSQIRVEDLVGMAEALELPLVSITDHDSVEGCRELRKHWPHVPLLPGMELSYAEGDFLLFCLDIERLMYIEKRNHRSILEITPGEDLAVVWAHPLSHRFGDAEGRYSTGEMLRDVMERIDGLEVMNGKMLTHVVLGFEPRTYTDRLSRLAGEHGKALVGGSDCHQHFRFMKCWTNVPTKFATPEGVINAIKKRLTAPEADVSHYDHLASYASR